MATFSSSVEKTLFDRDYKELPIGLCYLDTDLRYLKINEWLATINGLTIEEHLGRRLTEVLPGGAEFLASQLRQVLETGRPIVGGRVYIETPAHPGTKRHYEHSYSPKKSDDGTVVGIRCVVQDVTEREQALEALRKSEQRFELAVRGTTDGIWDVDLTTGEIWWSLRLYELLGYEVEEIEASRETLKSILHPDDQAYTLEALRAHREDRVPYDVEYRLRVKSGQYRWFRARGQAIWDETGSAVRMAGSIQDIHDSKQAELVLRSISEGTSATIGKAFFRSLVQHMTKAFHVNFAFIAELVDGGKRARLLSVWASGDQGETFEYDIADTPCEQVLVGKQAVHYPTQVWKRFPDDHWLKEQGIEGYFARPLLDADGNILGHMGVMHSQALDLNPGADWVLRIFAARVGVEIERLRAEAKLRSSETKAQALLENAVQGILAIDAEGRISLANSKAQQMFGYSREELLGQTIEFLMPPRFRDQHVDDRAEYFSHPRTRSMGSGQELFGLHKDGTEFPVEVGLSNFETAEGPVGVAFVIDLTVRKRAEERDRKHRETLAQIRIAKERVEAENVYLREEVASSSDHSEFVGRSDAVKLVLSQTDLVAGTDSTVLILGETGTGKELIARAVHEGSARKGCRLVKVNCAAIPEALIESEFFGHEKGAFTGALTKRIGRFELAHGGTIFLDEIGDLSPDLQAKLLRVLQDGEFERLGSTKTQKVDARVIAATNCDLEEAMAAGKFRPDLYYRLNVFPIQIPPLRARRGDIPLLVWHFINQKQGRLGKKIQTIPSQVMDALQSYDWPGNVRELENVIERALILSPGVTLVLSELRPGMPAESLEAPDAAVPEKPASDGIARLKEVERKHILRVLDQAGWRVKGPQGAASFLGLKASTLNSKMKKLGIERPT